jgi:hypothetical protein
MQAGGPRSGDRPALLIKINIQGNPLPNRP